MYRYAGFFHTYIPRISLTGQRITKRSYVPMARMPLGSDVAAVEAAAAVVSVADCGLPDSAQPPEEEAKEERGASARAPAR